MTALVGAHAECELTFWPTQSSVGPFSGRHGNKLKTRLLGVGFDFGGARIAHEKMLTTSSHTHEDGASSTYLTHSLTSREKQLESSCKLKAQTT